MPKEQNADDFRAAQGAHATFIATARHLSQITGLSPGQIRANLRHAGAAPSQRGVQRAVDIPRPQATPDPLPLAVGSQEQSFEPRPFADVPQRAGGTGPGAAVPVADKQLIVVDNGTANYYNFVAEFISAV